MEAKTPCANDFCKPKKNGMLPRKRLPLPRVGLLAGWLLLPVGLPFASARQQTPDRALTIDFIKASPYRRAQIRQMWLERGKNAIPEVLPLLNVRDVEAQLTALALLERAKATEAVDEVSSTVSDPNPKVRAAAAKVLGELANDRAVPTLFSAMADPDRSVRINAIFALVHLNAKGAGARLHSITLRTDADPAERDAAIIGLGNLHAVEAVKDLVSIAVNTTEQEKTRGAALSALGDIGDLRAVGPVVTLTGDASEVVRFNAAGALGTLKGSQSETALIRLVRDQKQPDFIRIRATWSLRNMGTDHAIQELFRLTQTENEFIAMHGVRVLIMTHTPGSRNAALSLKSRSRDAFVLSTLETLLKDAN
jgi:HEAT repeat protein